MIRGPQESTECRGWGKEEWTGRTCLLGNFAKALLKISTVNHLHDAFATCKARVPSSNQAGLIPHLHPIHPRSPGSQDKSQRLLSSSDTLTFILFPFGSPQLNFPHFVGSYLLRAESQPFTYNTRLNVDGLVSTGALCKPCSQGFSQRVTKRVM